VAGKLETWLEDKVETNKLAFPVLYCPASFIPGDVWRACPGSPATTNGNEQAHRDVNREGVDLTLLAL